jgi:hypothetical protein
MAHTKPASSRASAVTISEFVNARETAVTRIL